MQNTEKINVLIVGATGKLGSLITRHCITQPNLIVNILVRDLQKNKELTAQVEQAGGRVIKGDITQSETIKGVTQGMHTVILSISAEPQVIWEGQKAVIDDCVANGVTRIIPTEYAFNFHNFEKKELEKLSFIALKVKIQEYLKTTLLKVLTIGVGIFIESLYEFFFAGGFNYWGNADLKIQTTSYENSARFVAAAIARKDLEGSVAYAGNDVTVAQIAEAYNKVRGTEKQAKHLGTLEDLRKSAAEAESKGQPHWFYLVFVNLIFDERGRFTTVVNRDFPEVKPTTLEELLNQKPEVQVENPAFMNYSFKSIA